MARTSHESTEALRRDTDNEDQPRFVGTIEFFPEEGKYHLDGHRKCSMRMDPRETDKLRGICPVCGRAVTVGVMNRVQELADKESGDRPDLLLFGECCRSSR